jgi:ElaB/YqjD/DUF883 family membrane-anchored ribosome-binding protein
MANNDPYPTGTTFPGDATHSGTTATTYGGAGTRPSEGVREKVSEYTQQAKERASEFGRSAADTIDRNLDTAAGKLQNTADSLRHKAGLGEDKMSHLAQTAADKLDATARYFREHHTRDMVSGVEQVVRRNPGGSLCAALAIGFLLGVALKRDRY